MKSIIFLYFKYFVYTFIFFGFLFLAFSIDWGERPDYLSIFKETILFSVIISTIYLILHLYNLKTEGISLDKLDNINVKQKKVILSALAIDEIADLLKTSCFRKNISQFDENIILLFTKFPTLSTGEKITIRLIKQDHLNYYYELKSEPVLKSILIDFGQNLVNIKNIEKLILSSVSNKGS